MMVGIALTTTRPLVSREARLRMAVDAHYDVIWRFVRRMGVPEEGAEDAVQQVLLVFARKLDTVEPDAERAFLLGTALRVAADERKQRARRREVTDDRAMGVLPSAAASADVELDRLRARHVLDEVLDRLPTDLRTVFVMCDLEELTMSEVALAVGTPAGTVASRLRRARDAFEALAAEARARLAKAGRHE